MVFEYKGAVVMEEKERQRILKFADMVEKKHDKYKAAFENIPELALLIMVGIPALKRRNNFEKGEKKKKVDEYDEQ